MNWTLTDIAYMAAMIDGEGSIGITKTVERGRMRYRVRVYVTNQSDNLMKWLADTFGGRVHSRAKPVTGTIVHVWVARERDVVGLLSAVLPYLRVKEKQAALAIKTHQTMNRHPDWAAREAAWKDMAVLNFAGGKSRKGPRAKVVA